MKLCFKYGTWLLLAFWSNWLIEQAIYTCCTDISATATTSRFNISQNDYNPRQAIESLANYCAGMSCDNVDSSSSNVPIAKHILRFVGIYREFCPENAHAKKPMQHNFTVYLSDPNAYFIFGLRKIII